MLDYEKLRQELQNYRIVLDEDPSAVSLNQLHKKVQVSRGYLDRVRSLLLDARRNVRDEEEKLVNTSNVYKREYNVELMRDNIKILKTISQQQAAVEMLLQRRLEEKSKAEMEYNRAVDFFNDVKDTYADLRNAAKAVRDQIHIIDQQITIGELRDRSSSPSHTVEKKRLNLSSPESIGKSIATSIAESDFDESEEL